MTNITKRALIREPGYPVGQVAPMYLNCGCGAKVYVPLMFTDASVCKCDACGQKYNRKGYLIGESPKVDVLAVLRHLRDNAPAEWDALVATTAGVRLLNLWDALKREEKS